MPSGPRSSVVPKIEESIESLYDIQPEEPSTEPTQDDTLAADPIDDVSPDFSVGFIDDFRRLIATHNRDRSHGSRHSDNLRRQNVDGKRTREETRYVSQLRDRSRSRSPVRSRPENDTRHHSSSSSMFFPDEPRVHNEDSGGGSLSLTTTPAPNLSTEEVSSNRCTCPISYYCACRAGNKLDCRPLVWEFMSMWERRDQEAFDRHRMTETAGDNRTTEADLRKVCGLIHNFEVATTGGGRQDAARALRDWILEMEDVTIEEGPQQDVTRSVVVPRLQHFLSPRNAAVGRRNRLPTFIEEELTVLMRKWSKGDFDGAIMRGLIAVDTFDVNGILKHTRHQLDQKWEHRVKASYFGAGELVNGQLWFSRLELQRDGVHAPPIAGISGTTKKGVYSVVLGEFNEKKNEGYADIDFGDVIEYMGTALKDDGDGLGPTNIEDPHMNNPDSWDGGGAKPTAGTRALMKSFETGTPIRVIRSSKMCKIVKNKPRKGYRYDGLYKVVRKTALKEARQIWSFRLERLPGQGRLRGFMREESPRDSSGRRKSHFTENRR